MEILSSLKLIPLERKIKCRKGSMTFDEIDSESLIELTEICEDTENLILKLEKGFNAELFKGVKRNLHNLKGACGMFDLHLIAKICHDTESFLESYGERELDSETTDYLLSVMVHFLRCLNEQNVEELNHIKPIPGHKEQKQQPLPQKESDPKKTKIKTNKEAFHKNEVELNGLKIYHLDDEPALLEIFKSEVEEMGPMVYSFDTVASLRNGILNEGLPDVIVLDNKLKNGESGIATIKSLETLVPSIPKILYSAYLDNDITLDAMAKGAMAVLQKPLEPEILKYHLLKIKRMIHRDNYVFEAHKLFAKILDEAVNPKFDKAEIVSLVKRHLNRFQGD